MIKSKIKGVLVKVKNEECCFYIIGENEIRHLHPEYRSLFEGVKKYNGKNFTMISESKPGQLMLSIRWDARPKLVQKLIYWYGKYLKRFLKWAKKSPQNS